MRFNDVTGGVEHDRRVTGHYFLVAWVMGLYGVEQCSFIESFPVLECFLHMVALLVLIRCFRYALTRMILKRGAWEWQMLGQFLVDLLLMAISGFLMGLHNEIYYGAGLRSTLELTSGFLILGFFIGTDLALIHNRRLALKIGQGLFTNTSHFLSSPQKLILLTVTSLLSVMVILFFVFTTNINWLMKQPLEAMGGAKKSVLINLGFICGVLMVYMSNVVITYATNIRLFFKAEAETLAEVAQGNFDSRVPVVFNNEMGIIASYTNRMICGFKEQNLLVERLRDVIINSMASLAETRDNETGAHIRRTQHYVKCLAETLATFPRYGGQLDASAIDLLYKTAPLHDIGKVGVPDAILLKPGPLTDREFFIMKQHTVKGEEAIQRAESQMGPEADTSFLRWAREIAGGHHEKWDGTGYPRGLCREAIPLSARLMAVADVYDALRSQRVYKKAYSHEVARTIICEGRGAHFEPTVVDAFLICEAEFVAISKRFEDR